MTGAEAYKTLVLTSDPETVEQVTEIARESFENPRVLFWEFGNLDTRPDVLRQIETTEYNLIISYVNGIILKRRHLDKATYGAVNIHPAPPEHGGCWGVWCQPVIQREFRTHHGVLAHEMDEQIDHGPIYIVKRWDVPQDASIQQVFEQSCEACMQLYKQVCATLARHDNGSACFEPSGEHWHPHNRNHSVADVRNWFAVLDPAHPAHAERVWLNHPQAIVSPPYFDDV